MRFGGDWTSQSSAENMTIDAYIGIMAPKSHKIQTLRNQAVDLQT